MGALVLYLTLAAGTLCGFLLFCIFSLGAEPQLPSDPPVKIKVLD
ncbi:MAG: hypothetical protein AB1491_09690 [Thermodesulfobacteriota bacterium]